MSRIVERMMRPGPFRIDLQPTTPKSVLDLLRTAVGQNPDGTPTPTDGHILILPAWVDTSTVTEDLALWKGRLMEAVGVRSFSGFDLSSWLGTSRTPSPRGMTPTTYTDQTLTQWVEILDRNGILNGTVTEPGGTHTATWFFETNIEMLSAVCSAMGAEWRVGPDGLIDAGPVSSLYPTDPQIMFTDQDNTGSSPSAAGGLRGVRATVLSPTIDSSQRASRTWAAGQGDGESISLTNSGTEELVAYSPTGSDARLDRLVDAPQTADSELSGLADRIQAAWEDPRTDFDVAVAGDRWRMFVNPGELAYAWYPQAGILDLTETPFEFDGQPVMPRTVRIQQVEWSPSEGDGIYLKTRDGVTDLTEYVVKGGGISKVTVGEGNGAAELSESQTGQARFPSTVAAAERSARDGKITQVGQYVATTETNGILPAFDFPVPFAAAPYVNGAVLLNSSTLQRTAQNRRVSATDVSWRIMDDGANVGAGVSVTVDWIAVGDPA